MKPWTVLILSAGLVSALSIPQAANRPGALMLRQEQEQAEPSAVPTPETGEGAVEEVPAEEEENAEVEEGERVGEEERQQEEVVQEEEEEEVAQEEEEAVQEEEVEQEEQVDLETTRQRLVLTNNIVRLMQGLGLGRLVNANIFNLGLNQNIQLLAQLQQLAQLQSLGIINQFQVVTLIQQGRLLNGFSTRIF
ncbi:hypothetical protein SODALDRAFT_330259 [Sodiomyces alkalinus F11]|uniref:Uncharacterized protein n=1 Tax=Sodiomyces alkalinus (strain CBS 110278 / VKM F-3762 / F11) TaxID=1314773 RepID=A0A3N2Q1P0_SODAK|nr:hypothetical protein SODALDRAFT_330259 [Sodiomyces alkalinus F11]ROT40535.1 hypothetical protein SODALDRAFT_330259 [Sodiomyces alkalinus F11]